MLWRMGGRPATGYDSERAAPAYVFGKGLDEKLVHPDIVVLGSYHSNSSVLFPGIVGFYWFRAAHQEQKHA